MPTRWDRSRQKVSQVNVAEGANNKVSEWVRRSCWMRKRRRAEINAYRTPTMPGTNDFTPHFVGRPLTDASSPEFKGAWAGRWPAINFILAGFTTVDWSISITDRWSSNRFLSVTLWRRNCRKPDAACCGILVVCAARQPDDPPLPITTGNALVPDALATVCCCRNHDTLTM